MSTHGEGHGNHHQQAPGARRLLVVDDDHVLNELAQRVLRRSGIEVRGVSTAAEAMEQVAADPDLVLLLDQKLPDFDGTDLIRMLAERNLRIPFVAMTGKGNEQIAVEMMKLGAREYLIKDASLMDTLPGVFKRLFRELETEERLARTEQSLRESEEKLRTVADFTYDWEYWLGPDGRLIWVSPSCERITGYSAAEFTADPGLLTRIVHPGDAARFAEHIRAVGAGSAEPCEMDFRILRKSGEEAWISHSCMCIAKPGGASLGRRASNRDITDRKLAEEKLSKELSVNRAISELSGALIAKASTLQDIADITLHFAKTLTGSEHGFVSVIDQGTGDNVGFTLTRMMDSGCSVEEGQRRIIFPAGPDGRYPALWGHALNTRRAFYDNNPPSHPASRGIPGGHIPVLNFLAVPAMNEERLIGLIALGNAKSGYTDKDLEIVEHLADLYALAIDRQATMDALRASERQIRGLFNATTDSVMLLDRSGVILAANECASRRRGLTPREMTGKALSDILNPKHTTRRLEVMAESAFKRSGVEIDEIHGDKRYLVTVFPIMNDAGEAVQFATFSRDVTERARMQAMMVEAEKVTSIAGMAAGMAHEIRNPLSGIMQSMQVLSGRLVADTPANREAAKAAGCDLDCLIRYMQARGVPRMIEIMKESSTRMARIIETMLGFSRKSKPGRFLSDMNTLLDKAVELCSVDYDLKKHYDFRHISIERDYAEDLPAVPCASNQIEQVLMNLLRNAAQAMAENMAEGFAPSIVLRTRLEGDMVRVDVEDNGPGIDEETKSKIFEPFFTTKPEGEGTGLGLSVSYFIVTNNHHGSLDIESSPGKGTRFIIRLPLNPDAASEQGPEAKDARHLQGLVAD